MLLAPKPRRYRADDGGEGSGQTPGGSGVGTGQTPQAGGSGGNGQKPAASQADNNQGGSQAGQPNQGGQTLEQRLADMEQQLAETRREAGNYRTKLRTAETELDRHKNSGLSDADKAKNELTKIQGENQKLQAQIRERNGKDAVAEIARSDSFKAVDAAAVFHIVKADLEYDEDGKPTNVMKVLRDAKKDFPAMFKPPAPNGSGDAGAGAADNGGASLSMNDRIRQLAGRPIGGR